MTARRLTRRSALDRRRNRGIMNIEKGAADRRLAPEDYMEVTARLGTWGGYFFFMIVMIRPAKEMSTSKSWNSSSYVTTFTSP